MRSGDSTSSRPRTRWAFMPRKKRRWSSEKARTYLNIPHEPRCGQNGMDARRPDAAKPGGLARRATTQTPRRSAEQGPRLRGCDRGGVQGLAHSRGAHHSLPGRTSALRAQALLRRARAALVRNPSGPGGRGHAGYRDRFCYAATDQEPVAPAATGAKGSWIPSRPRAKTACVRFETPSARKIAAAWVLTVPSARPNSRQISLFGLPWTSNASTSTWRFVNSSDSAARATLLAAGRRAGAGLAAAPSARSNSGGR